MPIPIPESSRKRKRSPKLFDFHTFGDSGYPITPTGPFRDNIRLFLRQWGELEDYSVEGMPIWYTLLVHDSANVVIPLYTIEDTVAHSPQPLCDHCRRTGWANRIVSKRQYRVIIPNQDDWNKQLKDDVFHSQNHLLHGLIHCNGFGHLLCINGIEGGSKNLRGREIMDLWDRICTLLQARKITVEDVSKKKFMNLRLLHGVAYGHPWFGRWGYRFYRGFGVAEHEYNRAIQILSSLELDNIMQEFPDTDKWRPIKRIIQCYRDMSETQLITLKDLLRFMLTFKSMRTSLRNKSLVKDKSSNNRNFISSIASVGCRWSERRLESAAEAIVNVLLEKNAEKFGCGGISRQAVRKEARNQIGDTGLLDYVLKSMNNVIVGDHIVHRALNPSTRSFEYTIHELGNGEELQAFEPGADVNSEVVFLYRNVLLKEDPRLKLAGWASQVVLDSRHFVKEWPFKDEQEQDECGAEDDDGERMVACNIGEVWQHTRCHGIQDSETMPGAESEFGDGAELCIKNDLFLLIILFYFLIFIYILYPKIVISNSEDMDSC